MFSFSTENWTRPRDEVDGLMAMFAERIDRETPELDAEGVRMRFIGRRELVKVVHGVAEEGRIAVRNIRRDVMHDLRELKKEGEVGEDDERRAESELQKSTDKAVGEIDALMKGKEEEILTV